MQFIIQKSIQYYTKYIIQKILKYVAFESQKYAVRLTDNCGCPTLFREYRNFPKLISRSEDFEKSQLLVFLF